MRTNREPHDENNYRFPRTAQQAFGMRTYAEDFEENLIRDESRWEDVAVVVICLLVAIYCMFFGLGD